MPLISVVMSVYNGEKYLKRAIDSILNQTFIDFEFIIINDGSTDSSLDILQRYQDARILLINQKNKGLTKSLNIGIEKAKGKYIARQDADDVSLFTRLEKQVTFLENREDIVLLGTRVFEINGSNKIIGRYFNEEEINKRVYMYNPIAHASAVIRKDAFELIGLYDVSFSTSQDFDAWIRLAEFGKIAMLEEALVEYYIHDDSVSSKKYLKQVMNSYRARNGKVNFLYNLKLSSYQLISNILPSWIIQLKRKYF